VLSFQKKIRKFSEVIEIAENKSLELGIHTIDINEAYIVYTVLYLYTMLHRNCIRVIEINSGCGYFTLWIAKAMKDSRADECSSLISIESNRTKVNIAKELIRVLEFSYFVKVLEGNPKEILELIPEPIDVVFINNSESKHIDYLKVIYYKLRNRGLLIAHNVLNKQPYLLKFIKEINDPNKWFTTIIKTKYGISISIKP